eukprot:1157880-Pelagomonas_calceolata.AAC.9
MILIGVAGMIYNDNILSPLSTWDKQGNKPSHGEQQIELESRDKCLQNAQAIAYMTSGTEI